MNREDDPQLWDLLSRATPPAISPFFARNVVRAIRNETERDRSTLLSWAYLRRIIAPISAVAAVLVALFTVNTLHQHRAAPPSNAMVSARVQDADVAADLDVLAGDEDVDDVSLL